MADLEAIFDELTPLLTYITGKVITNDANLKTALIYQTKQNLLEAWRINNRTEYDPLKAAKHLRHAYTTFTSNLLYTVTRNANKEECIRNARKSWEENKVGLLTVDALNALEAEPVRQDGSGSEGEDYAQSPEYITRASTFKRSLVKTIREKVPSVGRNLAEELASRVWEISEKNPLRKFKITEVRYFDELSQKAKGQVCDLEARFPGLPRVVYTVWAQKVVNQDSFESKPAKSSESSTHSSPRDGSEPTTPEKEKCWRVCPDAPRKVAQQRVSRDLSGSFEKSLLSAPNQSLENSDRRSEYSGSSVDSMS